MSYSSSRRSLSESAQTFSDSGMSKLSPREYCVRAPSRVIVISRRCRESGPLLADLSLDCEDRKVGKDNAQRLTMQKILLMQTFLMRKVTSIQRLSDYRMLCINDVVTPPKEWLAIHSDSWKTWIRAFSESKTYICLSNRATSTGLLNAPILSPLAPQK